jgi:hypothetical protein
LRYVAFYLIGLHYDSPLLSFQQTKSYKANKLRTCGSSHLSHNMPPLPKISYSAPLFRCILLVPGRVADPIVVAAELAPVPGRVLAVGLLSQSVTLSSSGTVVLVLGTIDGDIGGGGGASPPREGVVAPMEDSANPVEARAAKRVAMIVSFMMMMKIVGGISF